MKILVNNKDVAIKQGTSFEFVAENSLFSDADSYTLNITFPLRGCPQNREVFGLITRPEVAPDKIIFDCEIHAGNFHRYGCLTITERGEAEIKGQFLEGRSENNFKSTFGNTYINELDLGAYPDTDPANISPPMAWRVTDLTEAVALPWVNDSSGNLQNCAVHLADGSYSWHSDTKGLSWLPYLHVIVRRIFAAVGYTVDLSEWEQHPSLRYLLMCNALPWIWDMPRYEDALPHWSIEEFIAKLELALFAEFTVNHRARHVSFRFCGSLLSGITPVCISQVSEQYSEEITIENNDPKYREAVNLEYADSSLQIWKYWNCDWYLKSTKRTIERFDTVEEIASKYRSFRTWDGQSRRGDAMSRIFYAADVDTHFAIRAVERTDTGNTNAFGKKIYEYRCILQPLNSFGPRILNDSQDAQSEEIEIMPVAIDYTDKEFGSLPFLAFSGFNDNDGTSLSDDDDPFYNSFPIQNIDAGEKEKKSEYYDRIFVGFYSGHDTRFSTFPRPFVDRITVADNWLHGHIEPYNLRLVHSANTDRDTVYKINPCRKCTFRFLSDSIPDTKALFLIRGKRYICEKITATISEHGVSKLLKGTFWPLADD